MHWLKRRKFWLVVLGLPALLLIFLHTQPCESWILREVTKRLPEGYHLEAARLDINLLRLSAELRDVVFTGPNLEVRLKDVDVNAGAGVLSGQIDFDSVRVSDGFVAIQPGPPTEDDTPFQMPRISLGTATIDGVALRFNDQETPLNLTLNDIRLNYEENLLDLAMSTPAQELGGRSLPPVTLEVTARTRSFRALEDLSLKLTSEQSRLLVKGRADLKGEADLELDGVINRDLLPEMPGVKILASLHHGLVELHVDGHYNVLDLDREIALSSQFKLDGKPLTIPIKLSATDLFAGQVELIQQEGSWSGTFDLEGVSKTLANLHPLFTDLRRTHLNGALMIPEQISDSQAHATLTLSGMPQFDIEAHYQKGVLTFSGDGIPVKSSHLHLVGDYDFKKLHVKLNGSLPHLDGLPGMESLPPELCAGPISFYGDVHSDMENWYLKDFTLDLAEVAYEPWVKDHIVIDLEGGPDKLKGSVHGWALNRNAPLATFTLDLNERRWNRISLFLDAPSLYLDDEHRYSLLLRADGSGPLETPELHGFLDAAISTEAGKMALISSPLSLLDNELSLTRLEAHTAHGSVSGEARGKLGDSLTWDTELSLELAPNANLTPFLPLELPRAQMTLKGNQDQLQAKLRVQPQVLNIPEMALTLDQPIEMSFDIDPLSGGVNGSAREWTVAGLSLADIHATIANDRITGSLRLKTRNARALQVALGDFWPADLAVFGLEGEVSFDADTSFSAPRIDAQITWMEGAWCNAGFWAQNAQIHYDKKFSFEPFKAHFAGVDLEVASARPKDARWPNHLLDAAEHPEDTGVALDFELKSAVDLGEFLELPPELALENMSGTLLAFIDADFERPRAALRDVTVKGKYEDHRFFLDDLDGFYHHGIWLQTGAGEIDNMAVTIEPSPSGFQVRTNLSVDEIAAWAPGFVGASTFDTSIEWVNESADEFQIDLQIKQDSGTLVYVDPWLAFTELDVTMSYSPYSGLVVHQSGGNLNGGSLTFMGTAVPDGDSYDVNFSGVVNEVTLETMDLHADLSTALEWHMNKTENKLLATAYVGQGYLAPNIAVKTLVEGLLKSVPELNFPDPALEAVQLEAFVSTTDPMIVETDIAYLEVEVPWLIIGGNLAEPRPIEGYMLINSGSSLDLGNQSFVFHDSQIQFLRNRPGDPYLLVTLEPTDDANKNTINLNGFLSELSQSVDTQNLTTILVNYLVGQVSTMVSLESDQGKTLYDDSFTFVVSKSLTRKVVTRYAIPVNKSTSSRRAELSLGPYRNNYLNLANKENRIRVDLQHSRKFGYPDGKRPAKIRKVSWPKDTPKWVKKKFKLRTDYVYSETMWRRARLDMVRRLKERGFLTPSLDHQWQDGVLSLSMDFGPQTRMAIDGPHMSEREMAELYRSIPSFDADGLRSLEGQVERLTLAKGYSSVAAMAHLEGQNIYVRVLVSEPIGDVTLNFGEAQALLEPLYKDKKARDAFITEYLVSAEKARSRLRARLAAKGYVNPDIGMGTFEDPQTFTIQISLGQRAKLVEIIEDGKALESSYLGKPFFYAMIDNVATDLQDATGKEALITLRPRRRDNDVYFEVVRTPLEETHIQSLTVTGTNRISAEVIERYLGFKPGMSQQDLVEAQQRLISAGPFSSARLRAEENATLEVLERNRWDVDLSVSWDERDKFGNAVQFHDYQLFGGFNSLGLRVDSTTLANTFLGRLKFDHVWGTRLDVTLGLKWKKDEKDPNPIVDDDDPFGLVITESALNEVSEPYFELNYPLTRNQQLGFGISYTERKTRTITDYDDNGDVITEESLLNDLSVPIRLSWIYKRLDLPTNPHNGVLATVSLDFFNDQGAKSLYSGQRLKANLSTFKTWGTLMWSNRLETGWFNTEGEIPTSQDSETTSFFLLGGSTSVRGYRQDLLGPLQISFQGADEERRITLEAMGGRSMFFTSQEITYTTPYSGLGITPFADAGWVWSEYEDWFKTGLVVTGGLGISVDTPVGYFRIDWARPLSDAPLRDLVESEGFSAQELKLFKQKQESSWFLRFGRVF